MRRTGMFYIDVVSEHELHRVYNPDKRLFIGTAEEAIDELKEEVKTLYPDEYDRIDRHAWLRCRTELFLYIQRRTQIVVLDEIKGLQFIRMEMSGGWKDEED